MIVHVYAGAALDSLPAPLSYLIHFTNQVLFHVATGLSPSPDCFLFFCFFVKRSAQLDLNSFCVNMAISFINFNL